MLVIQLLPPRDRGMTWSGVSGASFSPHRRQTFPYSSQSASNSAALNLQLRVPRHASCSTALWQQPDCAASNYGRVSLASRVSQDRRGLPVYNVSSAACASRFSLGSGSISCSILYELPCIVLLELCGTACSER